MVDIGLRLAHVAGARAVDDARYCSWGLPQLQMLIVDTRQVSAKCEVRVTATSRDVTT